MKRLFLASGAIAALAMAGCATQNQTVDYSALVANACKIATPELATLQTLRSKLAVEDQKAVDAVAAVVTPVCAAPPANASDAWVTLASVIPALTVLYVNNHSGN